MSDTGGEPLWAEEAEGVSVEPALDETRAQRETAPFTAPRRWWRGRVAQVALSLLLLLASVAVSVDMGHWHIAGLAGSLAAPLVAPSRAAAEGAARTGAAPVLSRGVTIPTATATPGLVGDGTGGFGGSWPTYTGPASAGQGCPSGQAPKPVSWAVGGAGDYGAPRLNTVALTFDDGPTPYSSPAILSFLESTHTPATFFVLGQYAKAYPSLVRREAADGFTIGVHTWSHPDMRLLTPAQRAWQFVATVQQIHADAGQNYCIWLWRPPYGSYNTSIVRQAGLYGLTTIMWNVDPADWSRPGTMTIVNRVLSQVRPGSIILLHDGPAAREQTAAALPYILDGLRARGLTPVSLPQLLLGYQPFAPSPTATPSPTAAPSPTAKPSPTAMPSPTDTATPTATAAAAISDSVATLVAGWLDDWRRAIIATMRWAPRILASAIPSGCPRLSPG